MKRSFHDSYDAAKQVYTVVGQDDQGDIVIKEVTEREVMAMSKAQFNKLMQPGLRQAFSPASKPSHQLGRTELREERFLMSPRFEPDMEKTRASTRIFERGEYEVEVNEPQPMLYEKDNGDVVAGVRFPLTMVGRITADGNIEQEGDWGEEDEDVTPIRLYVHTDAAWPMAKRFVMAALGYTLEEEDDFDEEIVAEHSFAIDGEPGDEAEPELGSAWKQCEGQRLWLTLDKDTYQGREQQTHSAYQPVGS